MIKEGGPSLVDCNICVVVVWWLYGGAKGVVGQQTVLDAPPVQLEAAEAAPPASLPSGWQGATSRATGRLH